MIGDIIKKQRLSQNMSRKTLSEGICTEKYIYLIERNERNPSAYILNELSEKLGIDLFQYYQYSNYENKTQVLQHKENFERYIQSGDIEALKKESLEAFQLEEFKKEPLSYDIIIIDILYKALVQGKTSEAIEELNDIFKIKRLNIDNLTLIDGYVVLSTCYQIEGQMDKAEETLKIAYDMISNKTGFSRYRTAIITVWISMTSFLYNREKFDKLIEYSKRLIDFQEKHREYNRIYYVDFYLSFAYYRKDELSKSKEHFMRGLHSALLFKSKLDMNFIANMKDFSEIINKLDINQDLVDEFYQMLN